ncbi:MAG: GAF domain-containing protein [Anaerolineales bacterium]|nr:GAF domain-containing protein [Anaerolineales bacterium]
MEEARDTIRFLQTQNRDLQADNRALHEEVIGLRRILGILLTLQEMATAVNERTDVLNLLDRILASALESIDAQDGSLLLLDDETQELVFVVVHGEVRNELAGFRIPVGQGIAGWVAERAEPVRVADVSLDPRFTGSVDNEFDFRTRSMLCVPMVVGDRVMGVIQALNKQGGEAFAEIELTLLGIVAQLAAVALHRAETAVLAEPAT